VPEPSIPPSELEVLAAIVETLLPGSAPGEDAPSPYPRGTAVGVDRDVADQVERLPAALRSEFRSLLRALEGHGTSLLLDGRWTRFTRLDSAGRARVLAGWSTSRLSVKRKGFAAAKRLAAWSYFSRPIAAGGHPLWTRLHYAPAGLAADLPDPMGGLSPIRPAGDVEETADVCVVGSGAGGSVVAERAARAGYRVVVLEAGAWIPPREYPRVEREAFDRMYLGGGIVPTRDSAFAILAGATPGGGTTINWMTCLPPVAEARAEWVRDGGLDARPGSGFDRALREVVERLDVSTVASDVNASNEALRRGSLALGYVEGTDWDLIPRNAVGCARRCGSCAFGCPYGARRSSLTTYLAEAMRLGARLYTSARAQSIEVAGGRARGVVGQLMEEGRARRITVRARAIVVAAGALETPALLLRSGVRHSGVGRGLRLDPTTALVGEFADPVRTWEGPPQTIAVHRFRSTDAGAHGPWIEVAPTHPGLAALATPWHGWADYRRLLERLEHVSTPIVLVRDVGEGRVTIDRDGRSIADYHLTARDRRNLARGLEETARILVAAGATRLLSVHARSLEAGDGKSVVRPGELERFVDGIRRAGVREQSIALFSAHPLGSARSGRDPRTSAARPSGEVHGVDGLWIGDGSLLPSAPGANPMLSILAVAAMVGEALVASLGAAAPSPAAG